MRNGSANHHEISFCSCPIGVELVQEATPPFDLTSSSSGCFDVLFLCKMTIHGLDGRSDASQKLCTEMRAIHGCHNGRDPSSG